MCKLMFINYLIYSVVVLFIIVLFPPSEGNNNCNENICASIVSKCLLTRSCDCRISEPHCGKNCFTCLGKLLLECCSCLDMCPENIDTTSSVGIVSTIGDFEGVPELFETLTIEAETDDDWTVLRLPQHQTLTSQYSIPGGTVHSELNAVICTIVYLNACTTDKKCSQYCESMGASSYRWFHDGCCECVGANCYSYGMNKNQCSACPSEDDDEDVRLPYDKIDYGENENEMSWDFDEED